MKNEIMALRSTTNVQLSSCNSNTADIAAIKQEMLHPFSHKRLWDGVRETVQEGVDLVESHAAEKNVEQDEKISQLETLSDKLLNMVEKMQKSNDELRSEVKLLKEQVNTLEAAVAGIVTKTMYPRGPSTPSTQPLFGPNSPLKKESIGDDPSDYNKVWC